MPTPSTSAEVPFTSECPTCHDSGLIAAPAEVSYGPGVFDDYELMDCPTCTHKEAAPVFETVAA
jgi:hypothetical protein